jgi:carbamoylphosphate synthase small subunit
MKDTNIVFYIKDSFGIKDYVSLCRLVATVVEIDSTKLIRFIRQNGTVTEVIVSRNTITLVCNDVTSEYQITYFGR